LNIYPLVSVLEPYETAAVASLALGVYCLIYIFCTVPCSLTGILSLNFKFLLIYDFSLSLPMFILSCRVLLCWLLLFATV